MTEREVALRTVGIEHGAASNDVPHAPVQLCAHLCCHTRTRVASSPTPAEVPFAKPASFLAPPGNFLRPPVFGQLSMTFISCGLLSPRQFQMHRQLPGPKGLWLRAAGNFTLEFNHLGTKGSPKLHNVVSSCLGYFAIHYYERWCGDSLFNDRHGILEQAVKRFANGLASRASSEFRG